MADDGIGLAVPHGDSEKRTLGLRLIDTLVAQLDGTVDIQTEHGTRFGIMLNAPGQTKKEL